MFPVFSQLILVAHAIVLNNVIVPDTFCQGVRWDGMTYKTVIEQQSANSTQADTWKTQVKKGQQTLCGSLSPNW